MNESKDLLAYQLLFVTGKGGIGKSFVASALAVKAARQGKRVCLVEANPQDQLSPLFGFPQASHQFREVYPGVDCINLDLHKNFRDFFVKHLGFEQLFDRLLNNAAINSFLKFIPGLLELTLLGRLYYEARLREMDKPYDLVIFDGFASGHFLNLMTTPQAVFQARIVGPLQKETERVEAFLREPTTGILMVTAPEPLIASECVDFCDQLSKKSPARIAGVWINKFPASISKDKPHTLSKLTAAWTYAEAQWRLSQEALQLMEPALRKFKSQHQHFFASIAPDLGIVTEPISEKLVNQYFQQSQSWIGDHGRGPL